VADEPTLEVLMERYVNGDAAAFKELYARTSKRVFVFLLSMTSDRSRAEDLCQIAFMKLHRARGAWITGSPVVPWLMAIARNSFLDEVRSRSRAKVRITGSGELPDRVDPRSLEPPKTGLREAIDEAINNLSPRQREAFVLTKRSGLSPRDAAKVLGTTETAVKLRVHRAYVALRVALRPHVSEES
jgi:RNA polymerase sigma-70 factor (ECF subfamily)